MAMRYKVPQDVQREDQILWFLTLHQIIILIAGFGISYWLFTVLNKIYVLDEISQILVWIPAGISAAFAFVKIKGVSLLKFVLLLIEQNFFRPSRRRWSQNAGTPFISMTMPFKMTVKKKKKTETREKKFTNKDIKSIVNMLDTSDLTITK